MPKKMKQTKPRFYVEVNGQKTGLHKTDGILLPAFDVTFFRWRDKAARAIERTRIDAHKIRTSLVAEFVQDRCPELATLFDAKAEYVIKEE